MADISNNPESHHQHHPEMAWLRRLIPRLISSLLQITRSVLLRCMLVKLVIDSQRRISLVPPSSTTTTTTYLPHNPHITKHDTTARQQRYRSFLPVWRIGSRIEQNTPKRPQNHRPNIHRIQRHTAHRIIAATLQDNVRPAEDQRVNHVRRASEVEREECARERQVLDKQHRADDDLEETSQERHGNALAGGVHMPGCEHVGGDSDGLDADRVGVDLGLGEGGFVVLEPEQEGVLEGEAFDRCADGGPEEEDPAAAVVSKYCDVVSV